jgi:alpha-tubulin suppressor-like RCC1 family protein
MRRLLAGAALAVVAGACTSILGDDFEIVPGGAAGGGNGGSGADGGGGSGGGEACTPNTTTCADAMTVLECDANGVGTEVPCADPNPVCDGGQCRACENDELRCMGDELQICAGGMFGNMTTCEIGCDPAATECLSVVDLGAGVAHTCAVLSNGTVRCWGYKALELLFTDQLDDVAADGTYDLIPTEVPGLTDAVRVSGGDASSCAFTSASAIKCWGWNGAGQLGTEDFADHPEPVEVAFDSTPVDFAVGIAHGCAALANGNVVCWGLNEDGQLGNGVVNMPAFVPEHQTVALGAPAAQVRAGAGNTCAITTTGEIVCWGANGNGELTNATMMDSGVPNHSVLGEGADDIAIGDGHLCGIEDSTLFCWGSNSEAELGIGPPGADVPTETSVDGIAPKQVALGQAHSCAIGADDLVSCWGRGDEGQLGDGSIGANINGNQPTVVPNLGTVVDLAVGYLHACVLTTEGQVLCWGWNNHGQLGMGSTLPQPEPTPVVW